MLTGNKNENEETKVTDKLAAKLDIGNSPEKD